MVFYVKDTRALAMQDRPEAIKRAFAPILVTELLLEPEENLDELIAPPPKVDGPSEQKGTVQIEMLDAWRSP